MLALPSAGYGGQGAGWRRDEQLIDALPYIDPLTPEVKRQVESLIEEEMRNSTKRPADYLKELPPMPPMKFEGHPALAEEYDRVRSRQPMPALDVVRYQLAAPGPDQANDPAAWRAAVDNAQAQLEHQLNRIQNLELMLKYGPNTWRAQNQISEALLAQQESELARVKAAVDGVNRERKLQQSNTGLALRQLEDEWAGLVRKNMEIGAACDRLAAEVVALGGGAEAAGAGATAGGEAGGSEQQQGGRHQSNGVAQQQG